MSIDPLAEKYVQNSPYAFAENKVVAYRELEGLEGIHYTEVNDDKTSHIIEKNVVFLRQSPLPIPDNASKKQRKKLSKKITPHVMKRK